MIRAAMLATACLWAFSATDATETDPLNGRAEASGAIMAVLVESRKRASVGPLTEAEASEIRRLILADGKLDATEDDLIRELVSPHVRAITIAPFGGKGDPVVLGTQSGRPRAQLESILLERYDRYWQDRNGAGWQELVREAGRSKTDHDRILYHLVKPTSDLAVQSNAGNTYKPVRDMISGIFGANNRLPAEEQVRGRRLLHAIMATVDGNMSDELPDFLYNWIRPKPAS